MAKTYRMNKKDVIKAIKDFLGCNEENKNVCFPLSEHAFLQNKKNWLELPEGIVYLNTPKNIKFVAAIVYGNKVHFDAYDTDVKRGYIRCEKFMDFRFGSLPVQFLNDLFLLMNRYCQYCKYEA